MIKSKSRFSLYLQKHKLEIQSFLQLLPLVSLIPFSLLMFENAGKAFILCFFLLLWFAIGFITKSFIKASLIMLVIVLPFNITFSIFPSNILNFGISVEGVYTNWLVPVISVIDIFAIIAVWELIIAKSVPKINWKYVAILFLYVCLQLTFHFSFVSLFDYLRIFILGFLVVGIIKFVKSGSLSNFDIKIFTYILLVSALVQVVIANFQVMKGASIGLQFLGESILAIQVYGVSFINLGSTVFLRGYGTFPHPNILASYLCFVLVILFSTDFKPRNKALVGFVILLGILLTFSKIGIFTAILILLYMLILSFNDFQKTLLNKKFFIAICLALSISLLIFQMLNINFPIISESQSYIDRYNLLGSAWLIFKQNFLFGIGMGNFVAFLNGIAPTNHGGYILLEPVHNIFVLFIVEIGIIPISVFAILFWDLIKKMIYIIGQSKMSVAFILVLIILGSFDHYLISLPQGLFLLMMYFVYTFILIKCKSN